MRLIAPIPSYWKHVTCATQGAWDQQCAAWEGARCGSGPCVGTGFRHLEVGADLDRRRREPLRDVVEHALAHRGVEAGHDLLWTRVTHADAPSEQ